MKKLLKKVLGKNLVKFLSQVKKKYIDNYRVESYSQDGEDIILKEFLAKDGIKKGFYVDIGAHHPKRFSNTYLFYKRGWNGINIDAMPGSKRLFNRSRKRDINLEIGISKKKATLTYYMFDEPGLNSFDEGLSTFRDTNSKYTLIDKKSVETYPLSYILDKYLPKNQRIDFMNIDVEGLDLEVLKSNNWRKYKPRYILIEIFSDNLEDILEDNVYLFLKEMNYILVAKTYRTCIFKLY